MHRLPGLGFLRTLVARRSLISQFVRRDFQQRFVGSVAGWLWGVIHPLVLLASWTFVFQLVLKSTLPATEITQNYTLFLFCGFLPWMLFQETVQRSSTSIVDNANLLTKTVFPAEVIPVSVFLSSLVNHLLAVALVLVAVPLWLHRLSPWVMLLPVYTLLTGLLAVGVGWIVASLQVYVRDTAQVVAVGLTFWFWVTPIFISEQQLPEGVQWVARVNPLAYLVRAYRYQLLSDQLPSVGDLAVAASYAVAVFVAGGLFFKHLKRGFGDVL